MVLCLVKRICDRKDCLLTASFTTTTIYTTINPTMTQQYPILQHKRVPYIKLSSSRKVKGRQIPLEPSYATMVWWSALCSDLDPRFLELNWYIVCLNVPSDRLTISLKVTLRLSNLNNTKEIRDWHALYGHWLDLKFLHVYGRQNLPYTVLLCNWWERLPLPCIP